MYTGPQRSGHGRSQPKLRQRFSSSDKFVTATREVLNSCPYNDDAYRKPTKMVSITVDPVENYEENKQNFTFSNSRNCKSQMSLYKPVAKPKEKFEISSSNSLNAYSELNENFLKMKLTSTSDRNTNSMNSTMCSSRPTERSTMAAERDTSLNF